MSETALRILTLAISASPPGAAIETAASWAQVAERLAAAGPFDAVLVDGDAAPATAAEVSAVADAAPLVVVVLDPDGEAACDWLRQGADDVVGRDELASGRVWRRVRFAVERRRRAAPQRSAHSTDPATGLPHRQQLVEHLSQLLALREREPAPMAVVALRVSLLAGADAVMGAIPAPADRDIVRRKVAVRLRAGVRASDVVAAVDDDVFAVLLGSVVSSADAERVAAKLVASLAAPFAAAGRERVVSVAIGVAHFPGDGSDAGRLLSRALALALSAPGAVASGSAASLDASGALRSAANDDR